MVRAVTPIPFVKARFFDRCGKPLAGGKVYTYEANTTTDKTTYKDPYGLTPNTNPIILDAAGEADIYLDGTYRIRITDRNDVLVNDVAKIGSWFSDNLQDSLDNISFAMNDALQPALQTLNTSIVSARAEASAELVNLRNAINTAAAAGAGAEGWTADLVLDAEQSLTQKQINAYLFPKIKRENVSVWDFFTQSELTAYKANPTTYDASNQIQAFFDYCHANKVINANAGGEFYITKPISYIGATHATNMIYGDLTLTTDQSLLYMLHLTGHKFQWLGNIQLIGASSIAKTRKTRCGLLLGYPLSLAAELPNLTSSNCTSTNLYIHAVSVANVYDVGVYFGNKCHFSDVNHVRGTTIGSCLRDNSVLSRSANISSYTSVAGDINQSSTLTVDILPYDASGQILASIDGQLYNVTSVDKSNSTITVYPRLPSTYTTGVLWYQQGSVVLTQGNDTSNLRINTLQTIQCGIGADLKALYGCNISTFTSEAIGAGVVLANKGGTTIGNKLGSGYFEGNLADIVYVWSSTFTMSFRVETTIALNVAKIVNLYTFRTSNETMASGSYIPVNGDFVINALNYNNAKNVSSGDLSHPEKVHFIRSNSPTLTLSINEDLRRLFTKDSALYLFNGTTTDAPTGTITINAPSGATINGSASLAIDGKLYDKPILVYIYSTSSTTYYAFVVTSAKAISATATYDPPSLAAAAQQSTTVTLTRAKLGDAVAVSFNKALNGTRMWGEVTAADTVTVYHRNDTGAAVDIASGTLTVKIV